MELQHIDIECCFLAKQYLTIKLTFITQNLIPDSGNTLTFASSLKKIVFHKFVWFRLVVSK